MFRFAVLAIALCGCSLLVADEADRCATLVVVSDRATASSLPPLPAGSVLVVLIQHDGEPDEVIHARALTMRHATHFVYHGGQEPLLSKMYRERLTVHGAIPVDLRKFLPRQRLRPIPSPHPSIDSILATLSTKR